MDLYGIKEEKGLINFGFYARNPEDIIDFILKFKQLIPGVLEHPKCPDCFKVIPDVKNIGEFEKTYIKYHMGPMNFNPNELKQNEDFFRERMLVTPDLEIACSPESVELFARHRFHIAKSKIGNLYELEVSNFIFGGFYCIPEDIAKAMVAYDLSPHLERNRVMRRTMNSTYDNHPGLARIKP